MRVAAVDCGTNSLRLLVADVDLNQRQVVEVDRRTTIVRLGQDVDRTGVFAPEALQRTFAALATYAAVINHLNVETTRFVATSAARDVQNRDEFLDGVLASLGVEAEIITGDEEAQLSYDGATRELARQDDVTKPVLVVDIGGGSTEFVMRLDEEEPIMGRSINVGSVRLTERHLASDPPTNQQVRMVVEDIEREMSSLDLPMERVATVVGVAGTVTTMAAMVFDLEVYDRDRVNGARLSREDVLLAVDRIVAMTVAERRALPFMHPDRADVIGAGALVLGCVVRRLGLSELRVSSHDMLDAIAWSLATRRLA